MTGRWGVGLASLLLVALVAGCLDGPAFSRRTASLDPPEALLLDSPYPDLLVEVDYAPGYVPSDLALDALAETLDQVTAKRRITILDPTPIPAQGGGYDPVQLMEIHRATFDHAGADHGYGSNGTLHVLYLDGERADLPQSAGVAIDGVAFLFPYWIAKETPLVYVGGLPVDSPLAAAEERGVLIHEVGHVLGLVGRGVPMLEPRWAEDGCSCHSDNPDSAMYAHDDNESAVPGVPHGDFASRLVERPWHYDEDDLADLAAFQR